MFAYDEDSVCCYIHLKNWKVVIVFFTKILLAYMSNDSFCYFYHLYVVMFVLKDLKSRNTK